MTSLEIDKIKTGDELIYDNERVKVIHIDKFRISLKCLDRNSGYGNIPIYERRPGNSVTNAELLSKISLIDKIKNKFK